MRGNRFWGWVAAFAIFGLASCGEEQVGEQGPREVVGSYQAALLEGDFESGCDLLAGEAAREFIAGTDLGDEEKVCPAALERLSELAGGDELAILEGAHKRLDEASVRVQGGAATVAIPQASVFRLERAGGRWYVADTDADKALLPTAQELRTCLVDRGAFNVEVTNVAEEGADRVQLILGIGPGGGRLGVLLSRNILVTEELAAELASDFETEPIADDRAVMISEGNSTDEEAIEACMGEAETS